MGILLAVILLLAIGALATWLVMKKQQHKRAILKMARRNGFTYLGKDMDGILSFGRECYPFKYFGHEKVFKTVHHAHHVIQKSVGYDAVMTLCDYTLSIMTGPHQWIDRSYTLMLLTSKSLNLPIFWSGPRALDHINKLPSFSNELTTDMFQSAPQPYFVRGVNEDAIRDLFHNNIIQLIKNQPDVFLEGRPGLLICYYAHGNKSTRFSSIQDWHKLLDLGPAFLNLFIHQ